MREIEEVAGSESMCEGMPVSGSARTSLRQVNAGVLAATNCIRCSGSTLHDDSAILSGNLYVCTKCVSALLDLEKLRATETPGMRLIRAAITYLCGDAATPGRMAALLLLVSTYNELALGLSAAQLAGSRIV